MPMTLKKAIEILDYSIKPEGLDVHPDFLDALKLGIEALKRFKEGRPKNFISTILLLPGETEV